MAICLTVFLSLEEKWLVHDQMGQYINVCCSYIQNDYDLVFGWLVRKRNVYLGRNNFVVGTIGPHWGVTTYESFEIDLRSLDNSSLQSSPNVYGMLHSLLKALMFASIKTTKLIHSLTGRHFVQIEILWSTLTIYSPDLITIFVPSLLTCWGRLGFADILFCVFFDIAVGQDYRLIP